METDLETAIAAITEAIDTLPDCEGPGPGWPAVLTDNEIYDVALAKTRLKKALTKITPVARGSDKE